jgi:chitin disaccharide deacetylase
LKEAHLMMGNMAGAFFRINFQMFFMQTIKLFCTVIFLFLMGLGVRGQADTTYGERLGFPKGARVIILHVDDAGMSFDSNKGVIDAMEKGIASSTSVMMPCPWVPGFVHYLQAHPKTDAGLHLTLTSEWKDYRWGPLSGKPKVPGLVDKEGDLWPDVSDVVMHASADEVEMEMRAQIERARQMGFQPTHMDSHMGTIFASQAFIQRYIKLGIEFQIPVMFPGGHNTLIMQQLKGLSIDQQMIRNVGQMLWAAGLPVLDDLHNLSYEWKLPAGMEATRENWEKFRTQQYIESFKRLGPGVTMVIMHCTAPTEVFKYISDSGPLREGDLLAMQDPALKKFIQDEGIVITTWRELKERRDRVGKGK